MTSDEERVLAALQWLHEALVRIGEPRAAEVAALIAGQAEDPTGLWHKLNANAWWGGAGSLAAATMAHRPGLPEVLWRQEVVSLREALIEIGEVLMRRGGENPGISSWVLAFRNWNVSGV